MGESSEKGGAESMEKESKSEDGEEETDMVGQAYGMETVEDV